MAKINQKVERFVSGAVSLLVIHRTGKTAISVFVRTTKPGQQSVIGARSVFALTDTAGAEKEFQLQLKDAEKKGYTPKVTLGGPAAVKFDTIPTPDQVPDGRPLKTRTQGKKAALKAVTRAVAR